MIAEGLLVVSVCAAGIYSLIPRTDSFRKNKIKKDWHKIMEVTKTKNTLNETFEIKSIEVYRYDSFDLRAKIPAGLTPDSLKKIEKILEYSFGGDVDISWDKYKGDIVVKVNKDPIVIRERIKKRWESILSSKEVRNTYKQYFDIKDVVLNSNSSYILEITTPISLSKESINSFKALVEKNLKGDVLDSFHNEENNIYISISHKLVL
ncbi:hypothetical protein HMPREF1982_01270 [Clostridiales bacterium oral taxon 876 str. F0540]|nr:hypothetical protein HMPREF1982_01270 [Clostridiales bacterium oral taxon 876 str. F0540]